MPLKEISNLRNLMFLDLSKNSLKYLPIELGECSNLSDLYLSENQLEEIPETIGKNNFKEIGSNLCLPDGFIGSHLFV